MEGKAVSKVLLEDDDLDQVFLGKTTERAGLERTKN